MNRKVRCQGVIIRDNQVLVLRQYNERRKEEYWLLPGGGSEENESEADCIKREMKEETNLEVEIIDVLFDEKGTGKDVYERYVTFLCAPLKNSIEKIGKETGKDRKILDFVWLSLDNQDTWNEYVLNEQFFPSMKHIKDKLM